jgi:hypothetical protein
MVVSAYTSEPQRVTAAGKRVPGIRRLLYGEEATRAVSVRR